MQAINEFIDENDGLEVYRLSNDHVKVLVDIREILFYPHQVQELVSAEKTPTLSIVLPLYETLIASFKGLAVIMPKLAHAIQAAIEKLEQYEGISRQSKIYGLEMSTCRC